ncbi:MAG: hypothetical protein AABW41_05495 [Nanoarchaeota archaeon]
MDDEVLFLYDELKEERIKIIREIINELNKKPFKHYKRAVFLRNYINALVLASKKETVQFKSINLNAKKQPPYFNGAAEIPSRPMVPSLVKINERNFSPIRQIKGVLESEFLEPLPEPPRPTSFIQIPKEYNISVESVNYDYLYKMEEDNLDDASKRVLQALETIIDSEIKLKKFDVFLKKVLTSLRLKEKYINIVKIKEILEDKTIGFGRISIVMKDAKVREIHCDGLNMPLMVKHLDFGIIKTNIIFTDHFELDRLITNIARKANIIVNEENPSAEGMLKTGERFRASLSSHTSNPNFIINK